MAGNDFTRITAEVTENASVIDSAITLFGNLSSLLQLYANDPAAINALADMLDTKSNELAAAVVAHTPTPPAP